MGLNMITKDATYIIIGGHRGRYRHIITNLRPVHSNVSLKNNDLNKTHHM